MNDADKLLSEIASYFVKNCHGFYYLREGYMFLPQSLIVKFTEYVEKLNNVA